MDKNHETFGATSVFSADLDGDGDMDLLSSSWADDKIAWYENTNGTGTFGYQKIISNTAEQADFVYASDIDNDGDNDVFASYLGKVVWYENLDGLGNFSTEVKIHRSAVLGSDIHIQTSDLDGDNDLDIIIKTEANIILYENIDGMGNLGSSNILTLSGVSAKGPGSIYTIDLDNDNDIDILSASSDDNKIAWYENLDGLGNFGIQNIISVDDLIGAYSIQAGDLDGDGDIDIIAGGDQGTVWLENLDGQGTFGEITGILYNGNRNGVRSIYVEDIDDDGDLDIVSASENKNQIAWHENIDGQAVVFDSHILNSLAERANSVHVADIDNNGQVDIAYASVGNNQVSWYKQLEDPGVFEEQYITPTVPNSAISSIDVDNDGDLDVLSFLRGKIAWFENIDGQGKKFGLNQIKVNTSAGEFINSDLDNDGDLDLLFKANGSIGWYENTGNGNFIERFIQNTSLRSIYPNDWDNDGDIDILLSRQQSIDLLENDGAGNFSAFINLVTQTGPLNIGFTEFIISDLNKDGKNDIITSLDNNLIWYPNDGNGNLLSESLIAEGVNKITAISVNDLDSDNDLDIVYSSENDDTIAWYRNLDGEGNFGNQILLSDSIINVHTVHTRDIDNDGDIDILSADPIEDTLILFENIDGVGNFSDVQTIATNLDFGVEVYTADIDNDGDYDILSKSSRDGKLVFHRNSLIDNSLSYNEFNEISEFLIYPNPTSSSIIINGNKNIESVSIYDINGKFLKNINNKSSVLNVDLKNLSKGIYILEIRSNSSKQIERFIKN
ncbi:T9SS type A sorting domain-containing protein [uncultured Aquimarina sp.]|uniref:T9SS type A sorting domain-containing protein n=1 Tax=uncultured Aquimarina sp. TaxID=575652 RepID=UPI0026299B33|nr:T9SS type A sorting domain-containing protein [uncultured Aquimarina sp.]